MDSAKMLMNTTSAWRVTEGSPEVVVAVIDSGIQIQHPDLRANLWTNAKEAGGAPGKDLDGNGYAHDVHGYDFYAKKGDPEDENGHGTHTAGTVAALKNGLGVIGVAPQVKIMPLRFLGPQGQGSTADAILAVRYAVRMGARIISASWGGPGYSSYLAQAVQEAIEAGVIFVAAAGNDGNDLSRMPTGSDFKLQQLRSEHSIDLGSGRADFEHLFEGGLQGAVRNLHGSPTSIGCDCPCVQQKQIGHATTTEVSFMQHRGSDSIVWYPVWSYQYWTIHSVFITRPFHQLMTKSVVWSGSPDG
jgi:hypothetical protein